MTAAAVLRVVLDGEPVDAVTIAATLDVGPDAVAAALAKLEQAGLVAQSGSGWRPGPVITRYAHREALAGTGEPVLRRLAQESGETANLVVLRAGGTVAIAQHDGRHLLGATNWVGRELPLHCTAAGKVFLAYGAAVLADGPLAAPTRATIVDRSVLARDLEAVREQGYSMIVDELEDGLAAVAAPVRDAGGSVVAALTVAGATLRLPPARLALLARLALEQAQALSATLGVRGSG